MDKRHGWMEFLIAKWKKNELHNIYIVGFKAAKHSNELSNELHIEWAIGPEQVLLFDLEILLHEWWMEEKLPFNFNIVAWAIENHSRTGTDVRPLRWTYLFNLLNMFAIELCSIFSVRQDTTALIGAADEHVE